MTSNQVVAAAAAVTAFGCIERESLDKDVILWHNIILQEIHEENANQR